MKTIYAINIKKALNRIYFTRADKSMSSFLEMDIFSLWNLSIFFSRLSTFLFTLVISEPPPILRRFFKFSFAKFLLSFFQLLYYFSQLVVLFPIPYLLRGQAYDFTTYCIQIFSTFSCVTCCIILKVTQGCMLVVGIKPMYLLPSNF